MGGIMALAGVGHSGPSIGIPAATRRPQAVVRGEVRPLSACGDIARQWSNLAARALEPNPCLEPGFLLPAAQHLIAFRDAALLLLWQAAPEPEGRRLIGLVPLRQRRRIFGATTLEGFSDRRLLNGTPLIDKDQAAVALSGLLRQQREAGTGRLDLTLSAIDPAGSFAATLARIAVGQGVAVDWLERTGVRPDLAGPSRLAIAQEALAARGKLSLREPRALSARRDAVEILLALEASGAYARSGRATLQDTREAAFLRSMSRHLGRQKLCRVALLMLDEQPIAAALTLGRGACCWLYLAVEDETLAAFAPLSLLLTLMRGAAPARQILLSSGLPLFGAQRDGFGNMRLTSGMPRSPAELAARMGRRIAQSLFRPRPATRGG